MAKPESIEVPLTAKIVWDKKSRKVGKLLERLAEVVEQQAEIRSEAERDAAFDAGYLCALDGIERGYTVARLRGDLGKLQEGTL